MKRQGFPTRARPSPRVFVGMSGGVDSTVSAALLKKAGYDVTGVFIKVWQPDWIECNWREERRDAMRATAHLGIPFITIDLETEYKQGVIDYMIAEYKTGRTPNPDVMCNREVKFGAFWRWATEQGADFIATGHYAQCARASRARRDFSPVSDFGIQYKLFMGLDTNKDQSYFLWTLNQNDLPHILFPVGNLTKPQVRRMAARLKLPNAAKKDSQGLCFIGKVDVKEFLKHYIQTEPGRVLNESGETIGTHGGALLFTIGERHGFTIDRKHKSPEDKPYYVTDKDVEQNTITVSNRDTSEALPHAERTVRISHVNWVRGDMPDISPKRADRSRPSERASYPLRVRSRYRQELQKARIKSATLTDVEIEFEEPQDTLTPGQSLVVYSGDECLGGGIIM